LSPLPPLPAFASRSASDGTTFPDVGIERRRVEERGRPASEMDEEEVDQEEEETAETGIDSQVRIDSII
jgi:hypothetical protein